MAKAKLQEEKQTEKQSSEQKKQTSEQKGMSRREQTAVSPRTSSSMDLMNRVADDLDRLFESLGLSRGIFVPSLRPLQGGTGEQSQSMWFPQIEVLERDGNLIIQADLPGIKKDDLKVEITNDALIIQGERRREHEEDSEGYYRSERSYGSFYRSIPLPEGVNADKSKAIFRDGILEVKIPAPQQERRSRNLQIE